MITKGQGINVLGEGKDSLKEEPRNVSRTRDETDEDKKTPDIQKCGEGMERTKDAHLLNQQNHIHLGKTSLLVLLKRS